MTERKPKPKRKPGQEPSSVLTRDAYERLRDELQQLTTEGRRIMADRLEKAREHGDIRENAEYDAAKNEQGLMEARIRELQRMLKDPDVVDGPVAADSAVPGVLVTVRPLGDEDDDDDEEEIFLLAASKEERADRARTVSMTSPLGQALAGRKVGERVSYEAPGGVFAYEILGLEPYVPD